MVFSTVDINDSIPLPLIYSSPTIYSETFWIYTCWKHVPAGGLSKPRLPHSSQNRPAGADLLSFHPPLRQGDPLVHKGRQDTEDHNGHEYKIQFKELYIQTDKIAYPNLNRYFAASPIHFLRMPHAGDNILSKALPVPVSLPAHRMEHYTSTAYRYKYLPSIPE